MKELKVYIVDSDKAKDDRFFGNNELFMYEAELQGTVYSIEGFVNSFNAGRINSNTDFIRIL